MKQHPILFSTPMIRALLDGRKTQTRRIVKPMPGQKWLKPETLLQSPGATLIIIDGEQLAQFYHPLAGQKAFGGTVAKDSPLTCIKCPYGQPGHQLWVRESFMPYQPGRPFIYKEELTPKQLESGAFKFKPSIHMPRTASRILLGITGILVERLQDITEADAMAEGIEYDFSEGQQFKDYTTGEFCFSDPRDSFQSLWVSINGQASWDQNPWLWVVAFDVLQTVQTPGHAD